MTNAPPKQPYIHEGMDSAPMERSASETLTDTAKRAANQAGEMFHSARGLFNSAKQPGMPLSVLSNVAREAPLATLFAAFLVGVMVGRRN